MKSIQILKRSIDVILSVFGIIIFFLPLSALILFLKVFSKGPVFYSSYRIGKDGKLFLMHKIRTMVTETPVVPFESLCPAEKYYTVYGKFLRRFGIDEIPQLYNILIGEMSFVGPRPVLCNHTELVDLRKQNSLTMIKPGLTGIAQINGRTNLSANSRIQFDKFYAENFSITLDFKIIIKTIGYILFTQRIIFFFLDV